MVLVLQEFTNPTNTVITADSAGGVVPTAAVATLPALISPTIDGSSAYIWAPNTASNQTIVLESTFDIGTLPILTLALPISVYFAYAANEFASVTASLEVVNLLGVIVATIPLFTDTNAGNPQNVAIASGDALIAVGLLGNAGRIVVEATVTSPTDIAYATNPGRYLGQITVRDILVV